MCLLQVGILLKLLRDQAGFWNKSFPQQKLRAKIQVSPNIKICPSESLFQTLNFHHGMSIIAIVLST